LQKSSRWKTDSLQHPLQQILAGEWKNGKREGNWRTWFSHGGIKDSLHYHKGELWGLQYYYDSTGHLYLVKEHQGKMAQVIVKTLDPRPIPEKKD